MDSGGEDRRNSRAAGGRNMSVCDPLENSSSGMVIMRGCMDDLYFLLSHIYEYMKGSDRARAVELVWKNNQREGRTCFI